jgi:hypothetical protein
LTASRRRLCRRAGFGVRVFGQAQMLGEVSCQNDF